MSLAIDIEKIRSVLLADGWHDITTGSFDLDAFEFISGENTIHKGGQSDVCATGFRFVDKSGTVCGPLTTVLAVRVLGEATRYAR